MSKRVLAITSSTAVVGVAIANDDSVLAFEQITTDRRHAEELTPMIERALVSAGVQLADIDVIAVDVGPGRFTGLRVGLATARTLALAMKIPVVGVTSLEILANGVDSRPVTAVIDARRAEVFQQRFTTQQFTTGGSAPIVGPAEALAEVIGPDDVVVGDGGDRYSELYADRLLPGREPSAEVLALMASSRDAIDGSRVEPVYLRDPDVQINIKTRHNT